MLYRLYRILTRLLGPFWRLSLQRRLIQGKEEAGRLPERWGAATQSRPHGSVIWCHAASVGETLSALPLLHRILAEYPALNILLTTGTVTSAELVKRQPHERLIHQYAPLDVPKWVDRFLNHWRPSLAIWIESELWPNMLLSLRPRNIPAVLLNAKLSPGSFRRWQMAPALAGMMMGAFHKILAQDQAYAERFKALGARQAAVAGNLKEAASSLGYHEAEALVLARQIGDRPRWLVASTHFPEENLAANAHKNLRKKFPDFLTTIVPRHPSRGAQIAEELRAQKIKIAQRSKGEAISADTEIYLADTLGELGLFFKTHPIVFMGGSLAPIGGHNLLEPARFGAAILHGPYMHNFLAMKQEFAQNQAALSIEDIQSLIGNVENLLSNPLSVKAYGERAAQLAQGKGKILETVMTELSSLLAEAANARS